MKKVIGLAFVGLLLLSPSEGISGQNSKLIATDHAPPIMVGMDIANLRWIISSKSGNPCAGHEEGCSIDVSLLVGGGKADVVLNLNEEGIIESISVD